MADRKKAGRAAAGTFGMLALEVGAAKLNDEYGWWLVVLLALGGVGSLAWGWWPEIKAYSKLWRAAGVLGVGLIIAIALFIYRRSSSSLEPPLFTPPAASINSNPGRVFVAFGPEYLLDMIKGRRSDEAQKLVDIYRGKWIKVQGRTALAPGDNNYGRASVMIDYLTTPGMHLSFVYCQMTGIQAQTAATLEKDEKIASLERFIRFLIRPLNSGSANLQISRRTRRARYLSI